MVCTITGESVSRAASSTASTWTRSVTLNAPTP